MSGVLDVSISDNRNRFADQLNDFGRKDGVGFNNVLIDFLRRGQDGVFGVCDEVNDFKEGARVGILGFRFAKRDRLVGDESREL